MVSCWPNSCPFWKSIVHCLKWDIFKQKIKTTVPWGSWVTQIGFSPHLQWAQCVSSAAKNATNLWFSISVAGGRQEIRQAGRQAADTISTPCPLHTSLRDCLNQNGAQKLPQYKRGPKMESIKTRPEYSLNLKGLKNCLNQKSLIMPEGPQNAAV